MYKIVIKTFGFLLFLFQTISTFVHFSMKRDKKICLLFSAFGAKRLIYI